MACVNPDGTVTPSAKAILAALQKDAAPEQIAAEASLPLFRVRSALRELAEAGLVAPVEARYSLTEEGRKRV
jgi:DNA-binding IclR family transcriptional regulator